MRVGGGLAVLLQVRARFVPVGFVGESEVRKRLGHVLTHSKTWTRTIADLDTYCRKRLGHVGARTLSPKIIAHPSKKHLSGTSDMHLRGTAFFFKQMFAAGENSRIS